MFSNKADLCFVFLQGYYDNPKVCALYVLRGTVDGEFPWIVLIFPFSFFESPATLYVIAKS